MSTEAKGKHESLKAEIPKPEIEKPPEECPKCDVAMVMGMLTGACETNPDDKEREACWENHVKGVEDVGAVESLTNAFVEQGSESMDRMIERANWLIYKASMKARERLIEEGKLPKPKQGRGQGQQQE